KIRQAPGRRHLPAVDLLQQLLIEGKHVHPDLASGPDPPVEKALRPTRIPLTVHTREDQIAVDLIVARPEVIHLGPVKPDRLLQDLSGRGLIIRIEQLQTLRPLEKAAGTQQDKQVTAVVDPHMAEVPVEIAALQPDRPAPKSLFLRDIVTPAFDVLLIFM